MERTFPHITTAHSQRLQKTSLPAAGGTRPVSVGFTIGSKRGNILHARLRMDMTQLNSHQHIFQNVLSPGCRCRHHSENIKHFVLHCHIYDNQRKTLFDSISQTLLTNFHGFKPKEQLSILLFGVDLNSVSGQEVAFYFQKFLSDKAIQLIFFSWQLHSRGCGWGTQL